MRDLVKVLLGVEAIIGHHSKARRPQLLTDIRVITERTAKAKGEEGLGAGDYKAKGARISWIGGKSLRNHELELFIGYIRVQTFQVLGTVWPFFFF